MNALIAQMQALFGPRAAVLGALGAPVAVILVLAMMVLPLPPFALDLMFTFNIAMAVMVMMVAANMVKPLDFAAFPTVLLLTTLLRLSLNVASTRVVLMEGHTGTGAAGKVIEAFGPFPDWRQFRGGPDRLRHPGGDQLHCRHQGGRADCRSRCALLPGCHARQADGRGRRPERRTDQRGRGQAPPRRAR